MSYEVNKVFENDVIHLDNRFFENCTFKNCTFKYSGLGTVSIVDCRYENPKWDFEGPADNTLKFLQALYNGLGEYGQSVVNQIFDQIKNPMNHSNEVLSST